MRPAFTSAVLGLALAAGCGGPDGPFHTVTEGPFRVTITETGELQAARYAIVVMPPYMWEYGQPKIKHLEKEGILVKKGDRVGQIETLGVEKALGLKQADLTIAEGELKRKKVEQRNQMDGLNAQLRSAEGALRMARMDTQRVAFESRTRREKARLQLRKAVLALRKIRRQIDVKKRVQAEDLLIAEAKITQIHAAIEKAKHTIERFTLRAPGEGMIEYRKNRRSGRKVAAGDQLWWGADILGLPDLSEMKILTTVNETDIDKAHVGQRVSVRLDAFPKVAFDGSVTSISRISRGKGSDSKARVFDVEALLDTTDSILRPGMTVSCEFLVTAMDQALSVHPSCIQREGEGYVVYVEKTFGLQRVEVQLGPRSPAAVVVQGDLKAGDRVLAGPKQG